MVDDYLHVNLEAPDFSLPDLNGIPQTLSDLRGRIVILNFWSAECPWSEAVDRAILALLNNYGESVALIAIASNANESADLIAQTAKARGLPLVLVDTERKIADLYRAQTTPHLFVIDGEGILRYQGAFNDVTFRQRTPTQGYLAQAVEALHNGLLPDPAQTLPYGCAIVRY